MTAVSPIDHSYGEYRKKPSPETLSGVVNALAPTINYALASTGSAEDPLVRGHAHLLAANAVETFDPKNSAGANLSTHVGWNLKQLSRTARKSRSAVNVPERAQLDSYKLSQSVKEFQDEHNREPDTLELADHSGIPVKRIEKVRRYQMSMPSEEQTGDSLEEQAPDWDREAMEYIYHESDHTDRRILEMKTGFGGHPLMTPIAIAAKLNLSPTQLTRRSMRLTKRINDIVERLPKI